MAPRVKAAIEVRNAALWILKRFGEFQEIQGSYPHLRWSEGNLIISHRTPFQRMIRAGGSYEAALAGQSPLNLRYGLDIWDRAVGKVLNVEWDDDGKVELVSFRRGDWEAQILSIPARGFWLLDAPAEPFTIEVS